MDIVAFQETINAYYATHKRAFPWRDVSNPYYVLVSEIMLQQTQTYRVEPKFEQFIAQFPTINDLASAPLVTVLFAWQGLGYNRRAKFLHKAAQEIVAIHNGHVPAEVPHLQALSGLGYATASSVAAFAYNVPTVFIETNIRAVFLHFFFNGQDNIHDKQLMPLVTSALEGQDPRQWYYALMDYGVMLKKTHPNPSRKSKHHVKQSRFEGSDRQIRGAIIRVLTSVSYSLPYDTLVAMVCEDVGRSTSDKKLATIVRKLADEGLLSVDGNDHVQIYDRSVYGK
ncbi:MAG: A/G-specific adenine glycosylase [Candidatus Dependentiae bacterium]|nr:A/G-specific adenine glycosylase [Candidatus Dependentiae bacterium]